MRKPRTTEFKESMLRHTGVPHLEAQNLKSCHSSILQLEKLIFLKWIFNLGIMDLQIVQIDAFKLDCLS
jgi:hypothetical protein